MSVYFHFTGAPVGHGPGLCPGERQPLDAPFSQPITPPGLSVGPGFFLPFGGGGVWRPGGPGGRLACQTKARGPGHKPPAPLFQGASRPAAPPTASSRRGQRAARSGGAGAAGGRSPPARCRASPGSGPAAGPWPRCAAAPALPAYRKAAKPAGLRLAPGKAGKLPALPGPPPIRMVPSGWRHMPPAAGCRKSGLRHFFEVFIAPLRLRRGQGAM